MKNQFELFDRVHIDDKSSFRDAMIGNWTEVFYLKHFSRLKIFK